MAKTQKETRHNADSRWFIRIDNGTTYGPVDLATLMEWASQGRVEPDNEISEDQESWQQAESLPELEMDWMAELDDGTVYGPFNIALAPELTNRGVLPANATLKHRETGETRTMGTDAAEDDAQQDLPLDTPPAAPKKRKRAPAKKRTTKKAVKNTTPTEEPPPEPPPTEGAADKPDAPPASPEPSEPEATAEPEPVPEAITPDTDSPEPTPTDDAHDEDDSREVVSQRLETLQKSASQARSQLAATRKQLTEQRAATSAMQDQLRKLQDDVRNAETGKLDSEQRLLDQQDETARATAEVENLNAQLEQLQDHYDRLQIESQSQFEELDRLRAEAIEHEQAYKHNIAQEVDRASAKTALMGQALRLIIQDEDLEKGRLPKQLLTAGDPGQLQDLQARVSQLQKQADRERQHAQQLETQLASPEGAKGRNIVILLLLIVILGLVCALGFILGSRNNGTTARKQPVKSTAIAKTGKATPEHTPEPATEQPALAGLITTNAGRPPIMPDAAELDLPPEEQEHHPVAATHAPIDWPSLSIARSTVSTGDSRCRVTFTYGLFASGTQLTQEGRQDLVQLSNLLRDYTDEFTLLIEGHTDATPITSSRSKYVDNYALGMARAEQVKLFLEDACNLPEEFIQTASAGEADPPYPNKSPEGRLKNRTVVLTLTPR